MNPRHPEGKFREDRERRREQREFGGKAPTARFIPAWASPQENRCVLFSQGLKARTIQPFCSIHSSGLQPSCKEGHFSLGDAALAQGWYKFAPLALNCGFQVEQKQDVPWILLCPFRARKKTTEYPGRRCALPRAVVSLSLSGMYLWWRERAVIKHFQMHLSPSKKGIPLFFTPLKIVLAMCSLYDHTVYS